MHWTRSKRVRSLAALNAGLAVVLGFVAMGPQAGAQRAGGVDRPRGTYLVIGGEAQGGNSDLIWVVDTSNQEMIALQWVDGRNQLEGIGYRDLRRDAEGVVNR